MGWRSHFHRYNPGNKTRYFPSGGINTFNTISVITPPARPTTIRVLANTEPVLADINAMYILDNNATLILPELASVVPGFVVMIEAQGAGTILNYDGGVFKTIASAILLSCIALDDWHVIQLAPYTPYNLRQAMELTAAGLFRYGLNTNYIRDAYLRIKNSPNLELVIAARRDNYPSFLNIASNLSLVRIMLDTGVSIVDQAANVNGFVYKSQIDNVNAHIQLLHLGNNVWKVIQSNNWVLP